MVYISSCLQNPTCISFWVEKASIDSKDINALRDAFGVDSGIWVEWIDSEESRYIRARPKKEGETALCL